MCNLHPFTVYTQCFQKIFEMKITSSEIFNSNTLEALEEYMIEFSKVSVPKLTSQFICLDVILANYVYF